jgi:hypothetical protein
MKLIKNFFRLILPPILNIFYLFKVFNKLKKYLYGNKFELEKNFYNRQSFILRAISKYNLNTCKYLEIGVYKNSVFNCVPLKIENKIGVDPTQGGTHRKTSDNFFIDNNENFDVVFIDGLHTYEQCQRDCINSLKFLNPGGVILFHDFLPNNSEEHKTDFSGDVWKVAVEIANSKNMEFKIANIDSGVGILKPQANYEYIRIPELKYLTFKDFYKSYYRKLPIINSEEALKFIDE